MNTTRNKLDTEPGTIDQATTDSVGLDTPLRLKRAVEIAFPFGSMTVSGLRRERDRGNLVIEKIAGKEFTTLRDIEEMRVKCRAPQKEQGCGLSRKNVTNKEGSRGAQHGSSETERIKSARDALDTTERALSEYISKKYTVPRERGRHPSEILVLDVLNIYLQDKAPKHSDPSITKARIMTLAGWWGDKALADVNGASCRSYVAHRLSQPRRAARPDVTGNPPRMVTAAGARRELEDLRSAINYHRTEGLRSEFVGVALPTRVSRMKIG